MLLINNFVGSSEDIILGLLFYLLPMCCPAFVDEQAVSMHLRRLTDWIQLRAVAACDSLKLHFCKG